VKKSDLRPQFWPGAKKPDKSPPDYGATINRWWKEDKMGFIITILIVVILVIVILKLT